MLSKTVKLLTSLVFLFGFTAFGAEKSYKIDYVEGYVKAYGEACSKPGVPRLLAKIQAKEAARAVAMRHLAEALNNVKVIGYTTVKDGQFNSSAVLTAVDALVKGAVLCPDESYSFDYDPEARQGCVFDYCLMVKLAYTPNGAKLLIPIIKSLKERGAPSNPPKAEEVAGGSEAAGRKVAPQNVVYDGVIVDASGLPQYSPTYAPIIVTKTPGGIYKPVFVPTMVDERYISAKGAVAANVINERQISEISKRWGIKHPLRIRAIDVTPDGALVISREDAIKLLAANQKTHFIEKGNVIIKLPSSGSY